MRKRGIRYSQGAVTPIGPVQTPATGIDTRDVQVCTETVLRVRTYTNMHGSWLDQNVLKALLISVGQYWKKKKTIITHKIIMIIMIIIHCTSASKCGYCNVYVLIF